MTCPAESLLLLFAEKLDPGCRDHVEGCAECRAIVAELEQTITELRDAAPMASNHPVERLMLVRPPSVGRRLFLAAAGVIVAVTGIGLYRTSFRIRSERPVPPPTVQPAHPEPARKTLPRDVGEDLIAEGLSWLARNQKPDGSIDSVGLTGLSLLAWFGAGHGETSPDYGPAIRSALTYLLAIQSNEGQFVVRDPIKLLYHQSMATWALAEAVGGNHTRDPRVAFGARKAVGFLIGAQNPGKGWRYSSRCGDNDTSVTFWAAGALAAARRAGLNVPEEAFDGARAWVREATDRETLMVGYTMARTGKVYIPGLNEIYHHHATMSAAGMALRLLAGDRRDEAMVSAVGALAVDLPTVELLEKVDYYYWHLGTVALFLHDGPESLTWQDWEGRLIQAMRAMREDGGSWKVTDRWAKDDQAGRGYATAINVLTLVTARRFAK